MLNNFNNDLININTAEDISYNCSTTTLKKNDESIVKSQTNDSAFFKGNFHCDNKFNMKTSNYTQNDRLELSNQKSLSNKYKARAKKNTKQKTTTFKIASSTCKSISNNSLTISDKSCMS